jgi:guanylate kinase
MVARRGTAHADGMTRAHSVLVIIGASGSGKSTLVEELQRRGLVRILPTYTTRPPRPAELHAQWPPTHRFVSDREFDELFRQGQLAHTGGIEGLPYRYGLPPVVPQTAGPVDTVVLRAPHVRRFVDALPGCVVYEVEASEEAISDRLGSRGGAAEDLSARLRDNAQTQGWVATERVADRRFVNASSVPALADAVEWAMAVDFRGRAGLAARTGVPPRTTENADHRRARAARAGLQAVCVALAAVVAVSGLFMLAGMAIALVGLFAGSGSNK